MNRIDSLLNGVERLDVIKIDIEGYEPRAWEGLRSLVRRLRPLIFSEFSPIAIRNTLAVDAEDYLKELFAFSTGPIQVLHRDKPRAACANAAEVMLEWNAANKRMGMDGQIASRFVDTLVS
ncbi:MAG: FkbM family methyltransferase [Xanthomonadales bacterium]|nr:FkbM family methyltransferase [Xanthomonadales bacterium]